MSAEFAGALVQRIHLLRRDATRDDLGGASGDWTAYAETWCVLAPTAAAFFGAGDRPSAAPRLRATMRARTDVAVGDRLQWRGLMFEVRAIEADPSTPDRIALLLEKDR